MNYSIGIDLGGRRIKLAILSSDGKILDKKALPIEDKEADWAWKIKSAIDAAIKQYGSRPHHIGLSAPGLAAADQRSIAFMPGRMEGLEQLDWTDLIDAGMMIPVLNDAHAAMYGESWQGAAVGFNYAFLLTLGTGVGGAVLADGRVLTGPLGRFGHLGHITLDPKGKPDTTGTPGSIEDAIGDKTIVERSKGRFTSTRELVEAVKVGDEDAKRIWLTSIDLLACALGSLINVLDPQAIILGGGMIQAGELLFEPLNRYIEKYEWRPGGHRVKIVPAQLHDFAGAIGAVRYAMLRSS